MHKNTIDEDSVFEINPNYSVTLKRFGPTKQNVVIVDDFYADPGC